MIFVIRFIFRNALNHPLRSGLTLLGIIIAILAFGVLRATVDAWRSGSDNASAQRLVTRSATSLSFRLPLAYKDKIRQLDGVGAVSYVNWFGGVYIDEKNNFARLAVEPASYLELYPEYILAPDQKAAFIKDRNSAIAGRQLAARFGWKIGDVIPLRGTIYPGDWSFVLRGIYHGADSTIDDNGFFFHWAMLNESLKKTTPSRADQVGFYIVGINNANQAAAASYAIDQLFKNSLAETLTETEKAFQLSFIAMSQSILTAIEFISFFVIAIIMVVMANTMAMSARERAREYATLRALGFSPRYIALLIAGESLLLALSAGLSGIFLIYPTMSWLHARLEAIPAITSVTAQTFWLGLFMALSIGLIGALIPIWRAVTLSITTGLRSMG